MLFLVIRGICEMKMKKKVIIFRSFVRSLEEKTRSFTSIPTVEAVVHTHAIIVYVEKKRMRRNKGPMRCKTCARFCPDVRYFIFTILGVSSEEKKSVNASHVCE